MSLAVQLDLDRATASRIDRISAVLENFPGLETVRQIGDVPHLSLGVYDDFPHDRFAGDIARFAETLDPITVRLTHIGCFIGISSVLFIGLAVTEELLALHRRFHTSLAAFADHCSEHYRPGAWVPHVTLAMNIIPESLPACVAAVAADWASVDATVAAARLIRFRPVETVFLRNLAPRT